MRRAAKVSIGILLSFFLLAVIVRLVGFEETAEAASRAGPWAFLAVGVLSAGQLTLQAAAWSRLNRGIGHFVRYRTLLHAVTAGMAVNIVTPSSYLGGEPVKVLYVGRRTGLPYHELAGTVVLAKYLEVLSFLVIFGVCSTLTLLVFQGALFQGPLLAAGITLILATALLLVLCAVLWIGLLRGWRPLAGLVGRLRRFRPGSVRLARLFNRTVRMESQISRVYREERRHALGAFLLLFLSHTTILLKPLAFSFAGGWVDLGAGDVALIFVTTQVLASLQVTPSGAGTLDGGLIGVFAALGLGEANGMAFLLCVRLWDAAVVTAGALTGARVGASLLGRWTRARSGLAEN